MKRFTDAAPRKGAWKGIAAELECGNPGEPCDEGLKLQIEHQFDMFVEIVGYADCRVGQRSRLSAFVERFNLLNSSLDLPNIGQLLTPEA